MTEHHDIVVWGASGFTGRLVAAHLLRTYGSGGDIKWAMAGRDRAKLERVAQEIGAAGVPIETADANDRLALDDLCSRTKVVITTVGPYQKYGDPLVAACVAAGTDYVDLSGEPAWMAKTIERHHEAAKASGARIVHSCGFDSIPFDLGVHAVQHGFEARHGRPARSVKGVLMGAKGGLSGGTAASLLATIEAADHDPQVRKVMGKPYALAQDPGADRPRQPDLRKPRRDEEIGAWLAPFVMADINVPNVHRSNMLLGYPYGQDFRYLEMMKAGNALAAWSTAMGLGGLMSALKWKPSRGLVRRIFPDPGEGPDEKKRETGFFKVLMVASDETGASHRVIVRGDRDPGYGGTSRMIGEAAMCLLRDADGPGGVLTPASAMGVALRRRLEQHAGVTFENA